MLDEDRVRFTRPSPARGGQTEVVLHPLVLLRRLAGLVPPPRQHPVRAFGVLAPAARQRHRVVPAGRIAIPGAMFGPRRFEPLAPVEDRARWARLLARTYGVDGHACPRCPGVLHPRGAVLPPHARAWVQIARVEILQATGPPTTDGPSRFAG